MSEKQPFLDRMDHMIRVLFQELKSSGGSANGTDVLAAIAPKLKLTPSELEKTSSGRVRWDTNLRFHTTDCVRAGFLMKSNGIWKLTEKGEAALALAPGQLVREAGRSYRAWRKAQGTADAENEQQPAVVQRQVVYEEAKEQARKEIDQHLDDLGPYEFQKLVAELLRAMGYHVPYVAPPGPDGGVDIIAYKDPLGTQPPRIKIQVKHRESKVDAKEVRELEGLLRKEGDVGLIVSSGGFTSDAVRELRSSTKHIETMDQDRLISLWQEHYGKVSESGKTLLPLAAVHFLAPAEE